MLFGTKCENFLCAQLWNKVRVFMVLNKNSAVSVVSGKVFLLLFRSPRTRRLFLSQLIKSTNYRKFKSKHIRNSTFCSPIFPRAPGLLPLPWLRPKPEREDGARTSNRAILCLLFYCKPFTQLFISMAMVMGPTPPGTGVIAEVIGATLSKSTSPQSLLFSLRWIPTSITTAPSFT